MWGGGVPAAETHQQQILSGQGSLGHLVRTLVWGGTVAENRWKDCIELRVICHNCSVDVIFKLFCNCSYCCDDVVAVAAVTGEGGGGGNLAEAGHQQTPRVEATNQT